MKKSISLLVVICLVLAVIFSSTGCGVVHKYDSLVAAYQSAQKAAATSRTSIALGYNKIQNHMDMYSKYLSTDVSKTEAYRKVLSDYGQQQKAYLNESGQAVNSSQLDLNKLVQEKATPADMAINIYAYVTQFTEAPLQPVDEKALADTQKYVSEAYNEINSSVEDWNTAVQNYNTVRNQATGDIVGSAAQALGIKNLPEELPYFSMPIPDTLPSVK